MRWCLFNHSLLMMFSILYCGCSAEDPVLPVSNTADASLQKKGSGDERVFSHDFGLVRPDSVVSHLFAVTNTGTSIWILEKSVQTCSCSVARATTERIEPRKSADFEFVYKALDNN